MKIPVSFECHNQCISIDLEVYSGDIIMIAHYIIVKEKLTKPGW